MTPVSPHKHVFATCRYYTHWSASLSFWLDQEEVLGADGTTDGGCDTVATIPASDPLKQCPPCRTSRCATKIASSALGFEHDGKNPCFRKGSKAPLLPTLMKNLKYPDLDRKWEDTFQACLTTSGDGASPDANYMLIGESIPSTTTSTTAPPATGERAYAADCVSIVDKTDCADALGTTSEFKHLHCLGIHHFFRRVGIKELRNIGRTEVYCCSESFAISRNVVPQKHHPTSYEQRVACLHLLY